MRLPLPPTLFTLVSVVILCSLGFWQLERLEWKEGLIADITAGQRAEPLSLDTLAAQDELPDLDYRRVSLTGRFMKLYGTLHMPSRVRDGQVGWHVVQYFRQDNGRIWLVNRGWLPQDKLQEWVAGTRIGEPATDYQTQTLQAIARAPVAPGWLAPDNDHSRNLWYRYDPQAMLRSVDLASIPLVRQFVDSGVTAYVLEAENKGDGQLPIGGVTRLDIPNNHLIYALTWFALALVLTFIYGTFLLSLARSRR